MEKKKGQETRVVTAKVTDLRDPTDQQTDVLVGEISGARLVEWRLAMGMRMDGRPIVNLSD